MPMRWPICTLARCLLLLISCLIAGTTPGVADSPTYADRVEQWGVQEVVIRSAREYKSPFTEVNLRCRFRRGSKEVVADGFYDGHRTWRVRLMPEVQGQWNFTTVSNDAELNGKTGSFDVFGPSPGN